MRRGRDVAVKGDRPGPGALRPCRRARPHSSCSSLPPAISVWSCSMRSRPWRRLPSVLPAVEHREAVADRIGVADVVGDEDRRRGPWRGPEAMYFSTIEVWCDAERRGRLVEDQHLGAEIDGAGDGDALALAARQRADRLLGIADVDADPVAFPRASTARRRARCRCGGTARSRCTGSRPMKKLRVIDISGIIARSW